MRKLLTGAIAVSATLALAAGAIADPNDAEGTLTVKATPSNAGTKKKPKNTKLSFNYKVDKPGTTVEVIDVLMPAGTKFSGKGFRKCDADELIAGGISACSRSKAGPKGTANARVGAAGAPLNFDVYPFVEDADTFLFYLSQQGGQLQSVVKGEITSGGRRLSITIPRELRQPVLGVDATLTGLDQTFSGKAGKRRYIVSSTGCKGREWEFAGKLTFAVRADGAAVPAPEQRESVVDCKK